jgi:hypothetical protein
MLFSHIQIAGYRLFSLETTRAAIIQAVINTAPVCFYQFAYRGMYRLSAPMSGTTTNLRPIHTYHAVPLSCRSAKCLDCLSHLIYTVRPCLDHTCHAVPLPFHEYAFLKATSEGHGRFVAGWRHGDSVGTACWRPASVRRLSATTRGSMKFVISSMPISDVGVQCETNNICHGQREAYYSCARTWVFV